MSQFNTKVSQLVNQNTTGKQKVFVRTFSLNPPGGIIGRTGSLFGLIEIESGHQEIADLIDLIIGEIQDNFYYPRNLASDQSYTNILEQFEVSLKNLNLSIAAFLETRHINLDLDKVNIVLGLSSDKELHFAIVGNVGALLFFHTTKSNYRIINIIDGSGTIYSTPNPLKLFSQVISGVIRPRDILFISTANIFDYFSLERIKSIITEESPAKGVRQLNRQLESINRNESFGALALELEKIATPEAKKIQQIEEFDYKKAASRDSIKDLMRTEHETAKLLTPSVVPEIKKYISSLNTAFKNYSEKIRSTNESIYKKQKIVIKKPNFSATRDTTHAAVEKTSPVSRFQFKPKNQPTIKKLSYTFKKFSIPALPKIKKIIRSGANHPALYSASQAAKNIINIGLKRFTKLSAKSKILLAASIILLVIFSYSIVWLGINNSRAQRVVKADQVIIEVEDKVNEAQATLIFRDENLARNLLIEARDQINQIKSQNDTQSQKIVTILDNIETQLFELRHIIEITEPIQIVNFQNIDSQAEMSNLALVRRNTAYTQNKNNLSIYKGNLDTRILGSILAPESNTGIFTFGTVLNDNELLLFSENKSAYLLNPNNDTLQATNLILPENSEIIDASVYNNRLYLLDKSNSQIYRYTRVVNGFGAVQPWVKESGLSLTDAVSIIVDGSVYVLKNNGKIINLVNGQTTDFVTATVDPPLVNPSRLRTNENSNFLYILDPTEQRVIIFDKEGNLVQQYYSEKFDNLKDIMIIESAKQIYVLNGTVIYGIPVQHL